jgi:hypothetical protein
MAFTATFHIKGHSKEQDGFRVISCDFAFNQKVDTTGVPISKVSGGIITVGLKNENDFELVHWMISSSAKKDGKIVFSSGITDNQSFQTINFKDAVLINYQQIFSEEDELLVNLTLSCRVLEISGASFTNIWETSD